MFPQINAQAKSVLRWYDRPSLRTRHTVACKTDGDECIFALDSSQLSIPAFQAVILGYFDPKPNIVGWVIKRIDGTPYYDLSAFIPELKTATFGSPNRAMVMLEKPMALPFMIVPGLYEMEIYTNTGHTIFSETFRSICSAPNPCEGVNGIYIPGSGPVVGQTYLYYNGTIATYCGLDCGEPVDENGFNDIRQCDSGVASFLLKGVLTLWQWNESAGDWQMVNPMACHHELAWRNCGDTGTIAYLGNDYWNRLFVKASDCFIGAPLPFIDEDADEGPDASPVDTFQRRDTDWQMKLPPVPWYIVDALADGAILEKFTLRLAGYAANDVTQGDLIRITDLDVAWNADQCLADVTITFRADDYTVNTGCCDKFPKLPEFELDPEGPGS